MQGAVATVPYKYGEEADDAANKVSQKKQIGMSLKKAFGTNCHQSCLNQTSRFVSKYNHEGYMPIG